MYDDMPPLVPAADGGGANSVMPGGFGAGLPQPQMSQQPSQSRRAMQRSAQRHSLRGTSMSAPSTPGHASWFPPPTPATATTATFVLSPPPPSLSAPPHDPFSIPAAAYDRERAAAAAAASSAFGGGSGVRLDPFSQAQMPVPVPVTPSASGSAGHTPWAAFTRRASLAPSGGESSDDTGGAGEGSSTLSYSLPSMDEYTLDDADVEEREFDFRARSDPGGYAHPVIPRGAEGGYVYSDGGYKPGEYDPYGYNRAAMRPTTTSTDYYSKGHSYNGHERSTETSSGFTTGPRFRYSRPEDWRPDFSMPSRRLTLTRLLTFGKGPQQRSREGTMSKPAVHWSLDSKAASCSWDIRRPPELFIILPEQRSLRYLELQESALNPPPLRMRLTHAMLPWTVHITAGPGEVITVAHLLWSLFANLDQPVRMSDFWNPDVSEEDRRKIHAAWAARCAGDSNLAKKGIKRVDYLCEKWVFEGLKRTSDGWEMKMKPGKA